MLRSPNQPRRRLSLRRDGHWAARRRDEIFTTVKLTEQNHNYENNESILENVGLLRGGWFDIVHQPVRNPGSGSGLKRLAHPTAADVYGNQQIQPDESAGTVLRRPQHHRAGRT